MGWSSHSDATMISFHEKKELKIRARFLRAYPSRGTSQAALKHLLFARGDLSSYVHFLVLEASSRNAEKESITLPVEEPGAVSRSLPGAPMAFAKGEDQLADDIPKLKYPQGLEPNIQDDVRQYFKGEAFAAYPVLS
jgi:hypothetical protein